MKARSRSSSAIASLEQVESKSQSTDKKLPASMFKEPLAGRRSNPELKSKVKPPRPPPPNRQIPPRTYVHPRDSGKTDQATKSTALGDRKYCPVIIDTRAQRRQRNNRSPQPERPPLPYEKFVPRKQPDSSRQDHNDCSIINGSVAAVKDQLHKQKEETQNSLLVTPPPAKYEVVVPRITVAASHRKSSVSANNVPTAPAMTETSSTSFHNRPFPDPAVRGREVAIGGGIHNKVDNLANRRNASDREHRESVAVPYEVPTQANKSKREKITDDQMCTMKDSATVPSSEVGHGLEKQQLHMQTEAHHGNNDTDEGDLFRTYT